MDPRLILDLRTCRAYRDGEQITLRPKSFDLLVYLVRNVGRIVGHQELLTKLWSDAKVSRAVLKVSVGEIRSALGDDASKPRYIATHPRRGYRFIASARLIGDGAMSEGALVGRDREILQLQGVLESAQQGIHQIVFIRGEPGIGKSALAEILVLEGRRRGALIARGQCVEDVSSGEPYMPVLAALASILRDPNEVARFSRLAPTWLAHFPSLVSPEESARLRELIDGAARDRMLRELVEVLGDLTQEQTLVLLLEDLHWCDPSTRSLLTAIALMRGSARLAVVVTQRCFTPHDGSTLSHLVRELSGRGRCIDLCLAGISVESAAKLLESRLQQGVPPIIVESLHLHTGGNPLFLAQLAELIARQETPMPMSPDIDYAASLAVPETLQGFIGESIRMIAGPERELLEVACVVGDAFPVSLIAEVLGLDPVAVESRLETLVGGFVAAYGVTPWREGLLSALYVFRHALYRVALYRELLETRRVRLHALIGERLESLHQEGHLDENASILANHAARARDADRAALYYARAARQALRKSATEEALSHVQASLSYIATMAEGRERDVRECEAQRILGLTLATTRGYADGDVLSAFERAQELGCRIGAPGFVPLVRVWECRFWRGEFVIAHRHAEELLRIARDPLEIADAHGIAGLTALIVGDLKRAQEHLLRTDQADLERDPRSTRVALDGIFSVLTLWISGDADAALDLARRSAERAKLRGSLLGYAYAMTSLTVAHLLRQGTAEALRCAREAAALCEEHGLFFEPMVRVFLGWSIIEDVAALGCVDEDDPRFKEGIASIDLGARGWRRSKNRAWTPIVECWIAEAWIASRRLTEAEQALDRALAEATGQRLWDAEILRVRAKLLRGRGAPGDEVRSLLDRAAALARSTGAEGLEVRAIIDLAEESFSRDAWREVIDLLSAVVGRPDVQVGAREATRAAAMMQSAISAEAAR